MTITKKILTTSVTILAIAGMLLMASPAQAGFFDWFNNTPLSQEALSVRTVQRGTTAPVDQGDSVYVPPTPANTSQPVQRQSAIGLFFSSLFGGGANACNSNTAPWVKVLSPNSGSYEAGDSMIVKWDSCNMAAADQIFIILSNQDQTQHPYSYIIVSASDPANPNHNQVREIQIPENVNEGYYKVRVGHQPMSGNVGGPVIDDYSDGIIKIAQPANQPSGNSCNPNTEPWVKVLTPNGGESYLAGQDITVKWESCNLPAQSVVTAQLNNENGTGSVGSVGSLHPELGFNTTVNNTTIAEDGVEVFSLPESGHPIYGYGANFKILLAVMYEQNGVWGTFSPMIYDTSNNLFKISQPVVQPSGNACDLNSAEINAVVTQMQAYGATSEAMHAVSYILNNGSTNITMAAGSGVEGDEVLKIEKMIDALGGCSSSIDQMIHNVLTYEPGPVVISPTTLLSSTSCSVEASLPGSGIGTLYNSTGNQAYNLRLEHTGGNDCEIGDISFHFIANSTNGGLNLQSARLYHNSNFGLTLLDSEGIGISNGQSLENFENLGLTLTSGGPNIYLSIKASASLSVANEPGDYVSTIPYSINVTDAVTGDVISVDLPWQATILSSSTINGG